MASAASGIRVLSREGPRVLYGLSSEELATRCREAMLSFVSGSRSWGKAELARWLGATYRPLTGLAGSVAPRSLSGNGPPSSRPVPPSEVVHLLMAARGEVLEALRKMTFQRADVSFTYAAIYQGWVERCRDRAGNGAWAPADRSSMRLVERVLSLATVDYLVRPQDYLEKVSVCAACGEISFSDSDTRDACSLHRDAVTRLTSGSAERLALLER